MKICSKCKISKSLDCYNKKNTTKDGLQSFCRDCNRIHSKKYYSLNREKHLLVINTKNNELRKRNKKFITESKEAVGCVVCGEKDGDCLDYHHLKDKICNVADLANCYGFERILEEIKKCVVLCANCHRKYHKGKIDLVASMTERAKVSDF